MRIDGSNRRDPTRQGGTRGCRAARRHLQLLSGAALVAITAGTGLAQSSGPSSGSGSSSSASSPFSGLFGGKPGTNSPVDLQFRIEGGDAALKKKIRNASLLTGALQEGRLTGQDILAAARADYARILGTLYDNGFYSDVIDIRLDGVEASTIPALDAPPVVRQVIVSVKPGPVFRYSRAQIAPVAPETELPSDYKVGEVARTSTMKSAARAGVDGWRKQGHAKADVAATDIIADHPSATIDSRIALRPGPAVRFGMLHITGYERMDPRRLRKIAGYPEGEQFDPEKLENVRKRLRRSGVFSAITLEEAETLGPGNTLDVDLTVVEQKKRRAGIGFELSTIDGATISGYWMHRNLLGGGERLRVDAKVADINSGTSGQDYSLGVRLDRPATLHPDITAYVQARAERMREEDYDQDLGVIGFGLTYQPNDKLTADAALEYRRSRVDDDGDITDFSVLALPLDVTWDRREPLETDAKRGYWLSAEVTPFKGFNGTGSGLRAQGEGRVYRSFGTDDRFTLAGRARAGSVWGPDIADTPRDYLFYSGGGGSVRGQPYQSLGVEVIPGPTPGTFIKTGGQSVVNATAELRVQVREKIGLAAFADAGQVWADSGWQGDNDWHAGAGVGVRYKTPIGPLRFDVAGPVGGDTGSGVQVYLGLGQAF